MTPTNFPTKTTSDRLTTVLSYGALLLLIYLVFRIVEPFLEPLAWSGVLAIFFYPVHERILRRLRPNSAALVAAAIYRFNGCGRRPQDLSGRPRAGSTLCRTTAGLD